MKERLKKFYEDHEEYCIYAASLTVLTASFILINRKAVADRAVVWVGDKHEDGVHTIMILHKNGREDFWHQNSPE